MKHSSHWITLSIERRHLAVGQQSVDIKSFLAVAAKTKKQKVIKPGEACNVHFSSLKKKNESWEANLKK